MLLIFIKYKNDRRIDNCVLHAFNYKNIFTSSLNIYQLKSF